MRYSIYDLEPGDVLIRKSDNQPCRLKEVIRVNGHYQRFRFEGFDVLPMVAKRMFDFKNIETGF